MAIALKKRAALLACVPVLLAVAFGSAPGFAAAATTDETPLTPALATLAETAVAAAPEAAQAEAVALPVEGPGSLIREGGEVVVEAHFEGGALQQLEALGVSNFSQFYVTAGKIAIKKLNKKRPPENRKA